MFCPIPLLSFTVTITDNGNGKGQRGWDICPLPLLYCPLPLLFQIAILRKNTALAKLLGSFAVLQCFIRILWP